MNVEQNNTGIFDVNNNENFNSEMISNRVIRSDEWLNGIERNLNVTYRNVKEDERDTVERIINIGKDEFPVMFDSDMMFHVKDYENSYDSRVTAIYMNGKFAGFSHVIKYPEAFFVNYLTISPEFRNKGLGSLLLRYVVRNCNEPIFVRAFIRNISNEERFLQNTFYEDRGFICLDGEFKICGHGFNFFKIYVRGNIDRSQINFLWNLRVNNMYTRFLFRAFEEEDNIIKPKATEKEAMLYNFLKNEFDKMNCDDENWEDLCQKVNFLYSGYDWMDETFVENGKMGVKDVCGEILVPAMFDNIVYVYSYMLKKIHARPYVVMNDDKMGLVASDGTGSMIVPCEYEYLYPVMFCTLFIAKKDGKIGVMIYNGKLLAPIEHDEIYFNDEAYATLIKYGKKGFVSLNDWIYVKPEYDEIDYDCLEPVKFIKDGKTYYIGESGKRYEDIDDSDEFIIGFQDDL